MALSKIDKVQATIEMVTNVKAREDLDGPGKVALFKNEWEQRN